MELQPSNVSLFAFRDTAVTPVQLPDWATGVSPGILNFITKWVGPLAAGNHQVLVNQDDVAAGILYPLRRNPGAKACITSLVRLNEIGYLNGFLMNVNKNLPQGGRFVGCLETSSQRKNRILRRYPAFLNHLFYLIDYLKYRVWPKLPGLNYFYFLCFGHTAQAIPEMEALGRLFAHGFDLLETVEEEGKLFFAVKKTGPPQEGIRDIYGPIIQLQRSGKNGKTIKVYKFRTMFAYAEYLQAYIYESNGLQNGGKMHKDPRVNAMGVLLRKYWLDELPMLMNLLKGDLKLFGVRPISSHYLSLYPKAFQAYRKRFKPGLLPPFYADLPKTLDEIVASERRYLQAYERQPFLTDLRYFFQVLRNIFFKNVKSA
jgi:lipopolysaccharide/colanic/teichoic acid biosynthesis glycosyltransferase